MAQAISSRTTADELATISWQHPDGSLAVGSPMPEPQAEALARAFAIFYPDRSYTTRRIPWLAPDRGRMSRPRHRVPTPAATL